MTTTRPNGLLTPAQPVTLPDPYSQTAQREDAQQRAARAAQIREWGIDYSQTLTERERAEIRLKLELRREALNRGVTLRPIGERR